MKHIIPAMLRFVLPLSLLLTACDKVPPVPGMKVGKPYTIDGVTYYPEHNPGYDKIGEASWYGPGFHGKRTANGEVFNQNDLTAAHPTLPMPSLVRVTNLNNGKSIIVRINDRGPFKNNRIIDLSKKSSRELGITSLGKVRVQYLPAETAEYLASVRDGGKKAIDMVAYNTQARSGVPSGQTTSDQIVESTFANTETGQTVNDAAPVMTVSAGEISTPKDLPKINSGKTPEKPKKSSGFITEAFADDDVEDAVVASTNEKLAPSSDKRVMRDELGQPVELKGSSEKPAFAPVAEKKKPAKHVETASASLQKPAVQASGEYYIQVGAFSTEDNAQKLDPKLSPIGDFSVKPIESAGKTLWRVRLGPFRDKNTADSALQKVHAAGLPDARVVRL